MKTGHALSHLDSAFWKLAVGMLMALAVSLSPHTVCAQDIITGWDNVKTPPPPEVKRVKLYPAHTALLLLDFNKQTCNTERRPRCVASIPAVKKLLDLAREKKVLVVYSLSAGAISADIAPELAPRVEDPVFTSGPDKFYGTLLEKMLRAKKIGTVIVTGTAAHGAVLYTASAAALRGINVVVPVEGISAESLYAEQYVIWNLANAPRVSAKTTITRLGMIEF
jgi:nicotinamidase-related amidase